MAPVFTPKPAGTDRGAGPDYTAGTHSEAKCSYLSYVGNKFYEYVAVIETLYQLATNAKLREAVFQNMEKSEFWEWQKSRTRAIGHTYEFLSERWFGSKEKSEKARAAAKQDLADWDQHRSAFLAGLGHALMQYWESIKKRFHDCGFLYGAATLTTDGVFFVGELALGDGAVAVAAKMVKSLRFVVSHVAEKIVVRVISPKGGEITTRFTEAELAAKYGKPTESHVGGVKPDPNRPVTSGKKLTQSEYDELRDKTPNKALRKQVNKGQPSATPDNPVADTWLPGKDRTGNLAADHIVSMKRITQMDGFADLTKENQLKILNDPENFTGLSTSANSSKGAKSFGDWTTYGRGKDAIPVNPALRQDMIDKGNELEPKLQKKIYELLREQQKAKGQGAPFRDGASDAAKPRGTPGSGGEKPPPSK